MIEFDAGDDWRPSDDGQAPQHVLVVDDTEVVRAVACEMLSVLGCTVEAVESGRAALARLASGGVYDMILMDSQMPGLNGVETTRQILKDYPEADFHIVAMSAHTSASDQAAYREAGMVGRVSKPFRLDELRALLTTTF
jgi:CheY-like chemotaxis protein